MDTLQFPPIPVQNGETQDWSYTMRREMQEILPGLYLGPYASAMKSMLNVLLQHRITHIVCIRQNIESHFVRPNFPERFKYLVLDIADSVTENIIQFFPKVRDFIEGCLQSGGQVLVHGNAGISRSAALVIAYVMEKHGLSYKDAYVYVQQKRFCVNPNEGFVQQLMDIVNITFTQVKSALQSVDNLSDNGIRLPPIKEYEVIYRSRLCVSSGEVPVNSCTGAMKRKHDFDKDDCMTSPGVS